MLQEFKDLLSKSTMREVALNGKFCRLVSYAMHPTTGNPENVILRLKWKAEDNVTGSIILREADITAGGFNPDTQTFEFFDSRGEQRSIRLWSQQTVLLPADQTARAAKPGFEPTLLSEFLRLWGRSAHFVLDEEAVRVVSSEMEPAYGAPHHIVVRVHWTVGPHRQHASLTEQNILDGRFDPARQAFVFVDRDRKPVAIQLQQPDDTIVAPSGLPATATKPMFDRFVALFEQADQISLGIGTLTPVEDFRRLPTTGEPDNPVLVVDYLERRYTRRVEFTESGIASASYSDGVFSIQTRGGWVLHVNLLRNGARLKLESAEKAVYVVVQEGGSSEELYVYSFDSDEDASAYRLDAWASGSYRTAPTVKVPASLAAHPAFFEVAQQLAKTALTLDGVAEASGV